MKRYATILSVMLVIVLGIVGVLTACTVSYKFTGTSIDYTKIKSISLDKFPIRANYVWSPMESMFYNSISDVYAQKTKLKVLKRDGDLQLAGEIVEYSQTNKSVGSEGFSTQVQLKIVVNVRFVNTKSTSKISNSVSAPPPNTTRPSNWRRCRKNWCRR